MNQRAVLIFCLILLTLSETQGIPLNRTTRCSCIKISNQPVNPRSLEKLEMIPASPSCPRVEIIATMKRNGEKICLNPESKIIKNILKAINKKSASHLVAERDVNHRIPDKLKLASEVG
ncbi:C-X-C motif chemokine 10 [Myotis brandtii]|uniref:C-X-C motif chemokine n=1 Tax=Myotis brandtii TaxID=109478 RepID=S7MDB7_MYOBR|nr:C-X-C motif chemokine 10 [Myotis brandtii]